jgi:hypothetical protein
MNQKQKSKNNEKYDNSNDNNSNNSNDNNNNSNNDDGTKSLVLSLEKLNKEYDIVLIKYNQAQKDYINYLKTQSSNNACSKYNSESKEIDQECYDEIWKKSGCTTTGAVSASSDWAMGQTLNGLIYDSFLWATTTDSQHRDGCYGTTTDYSTATEPNYNINSEQSLTDIKGRAFWGGDKLNEGEATSIEQCKAMCSADASCTGATYNSDKAYCWTRTGDGAVSAGVPNDYAIIPENLKYLKTIQILSEKLESINQDILKTMNKGQPLYSEQDIIKKQKTLVLNDNYKRLMKQRKKVEKTIKKYQDLSKSQNEGDIVITKNYTAFVFAVLVFLIIVFLFMKILPTTKNIQQGGGLKNNTYFFVFVIILITFIIWGKYT